MSTRVPLLLVLACLAAPAATTLTVHNRTGRTLAVTRLWSPWRPEPDDPPVSIPFFHRWIRPRAAATYRFQLPIGSSCPARILIPRSSSASCRWTAPSTSKT